MITVPLMGRLGLILGLFVAGVAAAVKGDNVKLYFLTLLCASVIFVTAISGLEALAKLGGA